MADESGWMPGVARIPTNAWGYSGVPEDGMYPQAVVCHVAQGYFTGLLNIARNSEPGKSWHFSVGRDGSIAQHVSIWNPAYHAGIVNDPQPPVPALMARFGNNPNTWSVGIEMEGFSVDPGYGYDYLYDGVHPWPEAQRASVIRITEWVWASCQWLLDLNAAERTTRILTHSMIDQRTRRQDPGDLWRATVLPYIMQSVVPESAPVDAGAVTPPTAPAPTYDREGALADLQEVMRRAADAIVRLGG